MRALRSLMVGALLAGASILPAQAAEEAPHPPPQNWSFNRIFGTYDLASAQRGFQVYQEVCAACHSLRYVRYRELAGIGLTPAQIRAVAASVTVPAGLDDQGNPKTAPGTPASQFKAPFPNEVAARAANNGAYPPDLSLMVNAREGGADYIHALLTGYADPPQGFPMQDGMNYNRYFPGHQIAMPKPLSDDQVTYADGTKATVEQMSRDVTMFLAWAANPELTERKQIGVRVILFLVLMTGLTYALKRRVWSDVH